jgi:hypothetical protein
MVPLVAGHHSASIKTEEESSSPTVALRTQ